MNEQEISELAAILVNEHGHAALEIAQQRKAQYAREPLGDAFLLWSQIVEATARLWRVREAGQASPETITTPIHPARN